MTTLGLRFALKHHFTSLKTSLRPLQVENCDSNSRLVVDEDANAKSGLKELRPFPVSGYIYIYSPLGSRVGSISLIRTVFLGEDLARCWYGVD